jgi:hypothetical protein
MLLSRTASLTAAKLVLTVIKAVKLVLHANPFVAVLDETCKPPFCDKINYGTSGCENTKTGSLASVIFHTATSIKCSCLVRQASYLSLTKIRKRNPFKT